MLWRSATKTPSFSNSDFSNIVSPVAESMKKALCCLTLTKTQHTAFRDKLHGNNILLSCNWEVRKVFHVSFFTGFSVLKCGQQMSNCLFAHTRDKNEQN
jgi:hypothetical protein